MTDKGDKHRGYPIHGDGVSSIGPGLDELGMPAGRRATAVEIIEEVIEANRASGFRWYKTAGTNELSCYWDRARVNMLWVTATDVHVAAGTPRPSRALTWSKQDGKYVGWLLPGAEGGSGGGPRKNETPQVRCPESFIWHPRGSVCDHCELVHST